MKIKSMAQINNIALVLQTDFGDEVIELAKTMSVWIIQSKENDAAIRKANELDLKLDITMLLMRTSETSSDTFLRALYDIDDHHGANSSSHSWKKILVYGAMPDLVTQQLMDDLTVSHIDKTGYGFDLSR